MLVMKQVTVRSLVLAACVTVSSGASATTTFLSLSLNDPSTGANTYPQYTQDITVTNLNFSAGLIPHYVGDAANLDQDGFTFAISALGMGTETYQPVCSGIGCGIPPRATKTWTDAIYEPFSNTYIPYKSVGANLFTPGDVLDATFNFVIPGGPYASTSPFTFSFQVTDNFLVGPYSLQLTDTTTGDMISATNGIYSLGPDSYALEFIATYDYGSGASIVTASPAISAVPLPATLPLMLGGLGLLGAKIRRKKTVQQ
jgi:hypothetical protein